MIIVVEIACRTGARASKEYDAPSASAAIRALTRDLRGYPGLRVTDIRIKEGQSFQQEHEFEEEW
jgi:hypothetical protein